MNHEPCLLRVFSTKALAFDGAVPNDFSKEDLLAMNPSDIEDSAISNDIGYNNARKRTRIVQEYSFPKYFYSFETFQHPLTSYFYNQMRLPFYDCIRLKDELIDFNCASNEVLDTIFNKDLGFEENLPNFNGKQTLILDFCDRIFKSLHDSK